MDSNPGGPLFFLLFIVLFGWAIVTAKGKWRLFNLLIILAAGGVGVGIGFLSGISSSNTEKGARLAVSLLYIFGGAGAYICLRRNTIRRKAAIAAAKRPEQ